MADSVSGIENNLCQGYQSVEHFGANLLDDTETALMHPIDTLGRVGSSGFNAAAYAVQNPLSAVGNVGSATLNAAGYVANTGLDYAGKVGSSAIGAVRKSVSFVGDTAENAYANVMNNEQTQSVTNNNTSNLDRVNDNGFPAHHTNALAPVYVGAPAPVVTARVIKKKGYLRTLVNWAILLLVIILIGVLVFLTCKRYVLAGNAYMSGNNMMAAALLSPELSTGLSTLAATL